MEIFMQTVTNIAAVVGCISACMALLIAIFKPLRKHVIDTFTRKSQEKNLNEQVNTIVGKLDALLVKHDKLDARLTSVEKKVSDNEADRLRAELFDCGNRCRRGIRLHPEEMIHIQAVYTKYSEVLHQNGTGKDEYHFICDYYNRQDFPEYHKHNNT